MHEISTEQVLLGFLVCFLSLLLIKTLSHKLHHHVPITVLLFTMGAFLSITSDKINHRILNESVVIIQNIDPVVIELFIIPVVIYTDSAHINFHTFSKIALQIFILGGLGGVIFTVLIGVALMTFNPEYFPMEQPAIALLLATILSNTDNAAVVHNLHRIGASEYAVTFLEIEAIFNDASAFVFFHMFLHLIHKAPSEALLGIAVHSVESFIAAPLVGVAAAALLGLWLSLIYNNNTLQISIVFALLLTSNVIAGEFLEVSGVLTVATLGLFMSWQGKFLQAPEAEKQSHTVFQWLQSVFTGMLFVISGVTAYEGLLSNRTFLANPYNWLHLLLLYLLVQLVRGMTFTLFFPLLVRCGYGMSLDEAILFIFGGSVRGAGGLCLVLLLQLEVVIDKNVRDMVSFYVIGIIVLTNLFNGTLFLPLYGRLRLHNENTYKKYLFQESLRSLEDEEMEHVWSKCAEDWLYQRADMELAKALIPDFSRATLCGYRVKLPGYKYAVELLSTWLAGRNTNDFQNFISPHSPFALNTPLLTSLYSQEIVSPGPSNAIARIIIGGEGGGEVSPRFSSDHFVVNASPMTTNFTLSDKLKQMNDCVFKHIRAEYHRQFTQRQLTDKAIVLLTTAAHLGSDLNHKLSVRTEETGHGEDLYSCLTKEWSTIKAEIDEPWSVVKWMKTVPLLSYVAKLYMYRFIFHRVEVLSGYWRSRVEAKAFVLSEFDDQKAAEVLSELLKECEDLLIETRQKFPQTFVVAQTVLTCIYVLNQKKQYVQHMLHSGLLEISDVHTFEECLESRIYELQHMKSNRRIAVASLR